MPESLPTTAALSPSLARLVVESPDRRDGRRIWRRMPRALRLEALETFLAHDDSGTDDTYEANRAALLEPLGEATGYRATTISQMEPSELARLAIRLPLRRFAVPDAVLRSFLVHGRTALLSAYLDHLGLAHESGILAAQEEDPEVDPDAARGAADRLLERFPPDDVVVYLATLLEQSPGLAQGLDSWLKDRFGLGESPTQTEVEATSGRLARDERDEPSEPDLQEPDLIREAREELEDDRPVPESPFTPLDRALIRVAVDSAQGVRGAPDPVMVRDMVDELLQLNSERHSSFFHHGFVDGLHGGEYRSELPAENPPRRDWYAAGWLSALARMGRTAEIVALVDEGLDVDSLRQVENPAGRLALPLLFDALCKVARQAEAAALLDPDHLLRNPPLIARLLDEGTRLLNEDDPERARPLFDRLGAVLRRLEQEGEPLSERFFLEIRRRRAHCHWQLGELDRARALLEELLDDEPDRGVRAMVLADLGLLDAGHRSLAEVRVWRSEAEKSDVLGALARGEPRFREAVATGSRLASHGAWPLAVLLMGRGEWDEARDRLAEVVSSFQERPARYAAGQLLGRVRMAAGIAEALAMNYTRLPRALELLEGAIDEGIRVPRPLLADVLAALEEHEEPLASRFLHLVLEQEARRDDREGGLLDLLADSATGRHSSVLARRLLERARTPGARGVDRTRDLRRAIAIHLSTPTPDLAEVREALDLLEGLAHGDIGTEDFLDLLSSPVGYEPAWDPDDAAWARIRLLEAMGAYEEAIRELRAKLDAALAGQAWGATAEARALVSQARSYGFSRDFTRDMEDRLAAWTREMEQEDDGAVLKAASQGKHPDRQLARVLVVGGDEHLHGLEERVRVRLQERGVKVRVRHLQSTWSGNWSPSLERALAEAERHDAVVLLRHVRTEFGRSLRSGITCPWVSCPGLGSLQVTRMVEKAAVLARGAGS